MKKTIITSLITAMTLATATTPVFAATPQKTTISENQAKQIALEDAGLKEKQVTFSKVKLETDHGVLEYEIEFDKGPLEYDYDIDAKTGAILSADYDETDVGFIPKEEKIKKEEKKVKKDKISEQEALDIAIKDAGLSKKDISYSEVSSDYEDGVASYDVEIHVGQKEYSYDIAQKDGKILDHDVEIDD